MKKKSTMRRGPVWMLLLGALAACSSDDGLSPFRSDGCSLFPDSSLITGADWCECCLAHDRAYWQGGTQVEREAADRTLRQCVLDTTGDEALAKAMYDGVRLGGSPYFYNWYRWGYGWSYDRKYGALTEAEREQAARLLAEAGEPEACERPSAILQSRVDQQRPEPWARPTTP